MHSGEASAVAYYRAISPPPTTPYGKLSFIPQHFFENNGGLYLIAGKVPLNEIRILAIERIKSIDAAPETYVYPRDFNPEEFLNASFDIIPGKPH